MGSIQGRELQRLALQYVNPLACEKYDLPAFEADYGVISIFRHEYTGISRSERFMGKY